MQQPPSDLPSLQVALDLDDPDGPKVARWRDDYVQRQEGGDLVDMCLEYLYQRRLCYSCGQPGDSLVHDEDPWVCNACAASS